MSSSNNVSGTGPSTALNELVSRMNAQPAQVADAQSQRAEFTKWLERHAMTGAPTPASANPQTAAKASAAAVGLDSPNANATAARSSASTAGSAVGQTLSAAQARTSPAVVAQSAPDAPHPSTSTAKPKPAEKPSAKPKTEAAAPKPPAPKKDVAGKDKTDKPEAKDKTAEDEPRPNATPVAAEGQAVVRELNPPPTIQPGDSAGMMAWLASLSQSDGGKGAADAMATAEGGAEGGATTDSLASAAGSRQRPGQATALLAAQADNNKPSSASQSGVALDAPGWQAAASDAGLSANLQLDALVASDAKSAPGDPLAGLLPAGALRAGSAQPEAVSTPARHTSESLATPFGSPEFPQALAERVSMWVDTVRQDGPMTAELHLNPAEMGPISVKISLDGQAAHVDFAAAAMETRQAIEASLPMLSGALDEVGLSLSGGGVSQQTAQQFSQSFSQSDGQPSRPSGRGSRDGAGDDAGVEGVSGRAAHAPLPSTGRRGGLDLYA